MSDLDGDTSAAYLYTALAILVVALIFLLKNKTGEENEPEPEQPVQRQPGPVQRGPGGRRRNFQNRRQRHQEVEEEPLESDEEVDDQPKLPTEKIGTKKARKLEEKEARAMQRKIEEEERQKAKELREEKHAERMKRLEEEEQAEKEREEEEKRLEEERLQREQEEYEKMKADFEVAEEGTDARSEEDELNLVQNFIAYIKDNKVCYIDAIASEFGLRNVEAVNRINALMESGDLLGVLDDRGKFIHITQKELDSVASWIKRKGRVSINEIQKESNRLIKLG